MFEKNALKVEKSKDLLRWNRANSVEKSRGGEKVRR